MVTFYRQNLRVAFSATNCIIKTKTAGDDSSAGTPNDVYLTMYDVEGNACEPTRLDNGQDWFELDA